MNKFKTIASIIMLASTLAFGAIAYAQDGGYEDFDGLDILKTCAPGTIQMTNARLALSFLQAFSGWQMKEQMAMIHPDYISWHSSLAGLLVSKPEYRDHVPFKNGQWTYSSYIETMAFLAFANDISIYKVKPLRMDCVGNDTVVLVTEFTGLQVRRDAEGCITHGIPFGSPAKISIDFKDYKTSEKAPVQRLVYKSYSNLDDTASSKVRDELSKIVQGPPNIPLNPGNCKTREQILKEFQDQANGK